LVGAQGKVNPAKKAKTPPLVTSPTENPKPKIEKIFESEARSIHESVEGLNSSLALAADELWPKKYRSL